MRRAGGFTLIEIAFALAIIVLIAGTVLLARDSLFGRAGTASLLASIRDLAAASREFKTRYGYFPGDLPNAATYITGSGGVSSGCNYAPGGAVGNGLVDTAAESNCALEHLVKAGMLRGVDYDPVLGRYVIAINVGTRAIVSLWYDPGSRVNAIRVSNLPCDIALEIDRRLDSATPGGATPLGQGAVTGRDVADAPIQTCVPGALNDPVPTLLVRY